MDRIINQWVENNRSYFKDRNIHVESNLNYDQGTQKIYIFSKEDKLAGIQLFIEDSQGSFITSGDDDLVFKEVDELPEIFRKIIELLGT